MTFVLELRWNTEEKKVVEQSSSQVRPAKPPRGKDKSASCTTAARSLVTKTSRPKVTNECQRLYCDSDVSAAVAEPPPQQKNDACLVRSYISGNSAHYVDWFSHWSEHYTLILHPTMEFVNNAHFNIDPNIFIISHHKRNTCSTVSVLCDRIAHELLQIKNSDDIVIFDLEAAGRNVLDPNILLDDLVLKNGTNLYWDSYPYFFPKSVNGSNIKGKYVLPKLVETLV